MKSSRRVIKQPDWADWEYLQATTLANAILLAQSVCPYKYTLTAGTGLGSKIDHDKYKIMQIAINHIESRKANWLIHYGGFPTDAYKVVVELPKFAEWILRLNLVSAFAIKYFKTMANNITEIETNKNLLPKNAFKDANQQTDAFMLKKPQRARGYNIILFHALEKIIVDSKGIPKAIEVLDFWRGNKHNDIFEIGPDYIKYFDDKGNVKIAELEALQKAISRIVMVS